MKKISSNQDIISHYDVYQESERLSRSVGTLEFVRTLELIERHVPETSAIILDVGGGPGMYSYALTSKGYEVHLIDLVPKHIEQAKKVSEVQQKHPIASINVGDARALVHDDSSVDGVLLMGPLYHLIKQDERAQALNEAFRVLRPGGLVFCAGINRFASLFDGLFRGFIDDPYFMQILERDIAEGQHRNPKNILDYFTTAIFHHPYELETEIIEVGFSVIETVAIEGPLWMAKDFEDRWADPDRKAQLLNLVQKIEHEPALLGISPHFMIIAKKNRQMQE